MGQMENLSMAEAIADVRVMLHSMISAQSGKPADWFEKVSVEISY